MNNKTLIVGTGGLARQILSFWYPPKKDTLFFNDITPDIKQFYGHKVITHLKDIPNNYTSFILAVGNPLLRYNLTNKFKDLGLITQSLISQWPDIPDTCLMGEGNLILKDCLIENEVELGDSNLINTRVSLHHGTKIGSFCEVGPNACLLGNVTVGNLTFIGAGAIIHPNVKIGNNCIIGAGTVLRQDVASNRIVYTEFKNVIKINNK